MNDDGDYLIKHYNRWVVRYQIPADVRFAFEGRREIKRSTGTDSRSDAKIIANQFVAEIKKRVAQARLTGQPTIDVRADEIMAELHKLSGDRAEAFTHKEIVMHALRATGMTFGEMAKLPPRADGLVFQPDSPQGKMVKAMTSTPFLKHVDAWQRFLVKVNEPSEQKTRDQYASGVREFGKAVETSIEGMSGEVAQAWIDSELGISDDDDDNDEQAIAANKRTVRRKMSGIRSYWNYLRDKKIVAFENRPFDHVRYRGGNDGTVIKPFKGADIVRLWRAAESDGDPELGAMIQLAAYTGARREEMARFNKRGYFKDERSGVSVLEIKRSDTKTEAGERNVPIHSAIAGLVEDLVKNCDPDGYLIHSTVKNQYETRATYIGKRFSALKTKLKFGREFNFHSIRHSVISMLEDAYCPMELRKDIVGHKRTDVTMIYAGKSRTDKRLEWMENALLYPTENGLSLAQDKT